MPVGDKVEFSAKIPSELYEEFKEFVPHYGGTQWFINAALTSFLERCRENPSVKDSVGLSVDAMLQLNRQLKEAAV